MHIVLTGNTTFKLANFRAGLLRRLVGAGHAVTVMAPPDDYVGTVHDMGCDFVPLKMDRNGTSPVAELRLLIAIFLNLRRLRPSFVFSYTIKNNIYAGLACRILGIPFAANVTGLGPAFNRADALNRLIRLLYRLAFRRAEAVFFQNESDRDIFLAGRLVPADRIHLLPGSGVDLTRFTARPFPASRETRFLLVARMLWDKGVGLFADAAEQVRRTHPEARFQLLGPLDPDSKTGIPQGRIDQWVEDGRLDYLGAATDVRPAFEQAHCIVLPSYYREGTPRTLLEAGATGRPVITSDMPGCRDPVIPGISGTLVRPRDSQDLARACIAFLDKSRDEQAGMGRAARKKMEQDYDERIVIDAYMSLLSKAGLA
ncbi:MAG TPA: glycosyltransferase family 4 protein [Sphingopyxis sp.]|nr:glycosyltransferase family 4 protein [Sphingopyxis sp.]